jgi:hypothetical protein
MSLGNEGLLTLTIKMRISPEPEYEKELISLMKRYREARDNKKRSKKFNKELTLWFYRRIKFCIEYEAKERKLGVTKVNLRRPLQSVLSVVRSWLRMGIEY